MGIAYRPEKLQSGKYIKSSTCDKSGFFDGLREWKLAELSGNSQCSCDQQKYRYLVHYPVDSCKDLDLKRGRVGMARV